MPAKEKHPLEILMEKVPVEVIDIGKEQAEPMADLKAFKEAADAFTPDEYWTDAPYALLRRAGQYAWNQFDQFAEVLIHAAVAAGVEERFIREAVALERYLYIESPNKASDILSAIKQAAEDNAHADQVSVLSIPCGSGKSTALTRLIHETLARSDGSGLIIVTDSVDRMEEYWKPESENPGFDDALLRFIARNKDQVAVINSKNYDSMKTKQYFASVVVLTTQRYFTWTPERVREMLKWQGGTRPLIVFDEVPYLSEQRDVTVETFNTVATALRMNIEATDEESRTKKDEAIALWEGIRERLQNEMDAMEYTPELSYAYIATKEDVDLEGFLAYIHEHRSELDSAKTKVIQMVEDVCRLLQGWGIYSHRSIVQSGKYESKYTIHVEHRDLVTGLDAKVIVLDGTADVSPMYDEDYIHMVPTRNFTRSLAYLTIKLCDVPTGMQDLRNDAGSTAKMIRNYLADANHDRELVIFASEKAEKSFRSLGFDADHTGHFNNIKGLNSYSRAVNIAQVGLNRKPPVEYLTQDLARKDEIRSRLAADSEKEGLIPAMTKARRNLAYSGLTMTRHVLADLEQNMYRGAIRNAANTQPFTYYVFFEHRAYEPLIRRIRDRYEALGVTVEIVSRDEVEAYREEDSSLARIRKIAEWYKAWDGTAIKRSVLIDALGMKRSEYDAAMRKREAGEIKAKMQEAAQVAKERGYKAGWYMKA